jgi:hypothetical protein
VLRMLTLVDGLAIVALALPLLMILYRIYEVPGLDFQLGMTGLAAAWLLWIRLEWDVYWPLALQIPLCVAVALRAARIKRAYQRDST